MQPSAIEIDRWKCIGIYHQVRFYEHQFVWRMAIVEWQKFDMRNSGSYGSCGSAGVTRKPNYLSRHSI